MNQKITVEDALGCWNLENDAGNGYSVGEELMSPADAADAEGYSEIEIIDPTGNVICMDGPDVIVICDANGPWACKIKIGEQDGK